MVYYVLAYAACVATLLSAVLAARRNLARGQGRRRAEEEPVSLPLVNTGAGCQRFPLDLMRLGMELHGGRADCEEARESAGLSSDRRARD
jgi:hypothetical protein